MARAFVGSYSVQQIAAGGATDTFTVPLSVVFIGADVTSGNGVDIDAIVVTLSFADTLAAMSTKIVDAVVAKATALGYTVARSGVLMAGMAKGS